MTDKRENAQKTAVVTGASRGIGKAVALELLDAGFFTALCARNEKSLNCLADDLASFSGNFTTSQFDVSCEEDVEKFAARLAREGKRVDVLVNNAGVVHVGPVEETAADEWDEIMAVNAKGVFLMVKHCLPLMGAGSHIVNIGSNASKKGFPGWAAYCASKFAVLGFTNSIREEMRDRGIRVSAVLPGPTRTGVWDSLDGNWDFSKMMGPEVTAKVVLSVVSQPDGASVDEIDIVPSAGRL